MAARAAAEPTGAAVTTPTMPAIVRRPRQQPPPSPCAVMNPTDRNAEPVRGRNAHQVRGELGRVVEVVPAEQSDAARYAWTSIPDRSTRLNDTSPTKASVGSRTRPKARRPSRHDLRLQPSPEQ
jgi:hypothetical protein